MGRRTLGDSRLGRRELSVFRRGRKELGVFRFGQRELSGSRRLELRRLELGDSRLGQREIGAPGWDGGDSAAPGLDGGLGGSRLGWRELCDCNLRRRELSGSRLE